MMKRFASGRSQILLIVLAVLAVCFGSAVPASAGPQAFFGAQLKTFIPQQPPLPDECLDVDLGTAGNVRTNVHLWHCRPAGDPEVGYQEFDQRSIPGRPPTEFKLKNQRTGKCLTYNVNGPALSPVWAESCDKNGQGWSSPNSIFQFVAVETDPAIKKCLDVVGTEGHEGTGIDLFNCSPQGNYNEWYTVGH
jgi:ricin-type beta-trefoil lectin protein